MPANDLAKIIAVLQSGGIIAYPTEAVYGLGCDPFNEDAVKRILQLKQRTPDKGLILIAANWDQIKGLVADVSQAILQKVLATWPGPTTWLLPASAKVPSWIKGDHSSIALRVSAHPVVQQICSAYGGPIVSTSANVADQLPARNIHEVLQQFPHGIDFMVPGEVGPLSQPTTIRDALTDAVKR
jgi:L-threonylcarbamoyladenylate synthase